jgi:hypothetical protein
MMVLELICRVVANFLCSVLLGFLRVPLTRKNRSCACVYVLLPRVRVRLHVTMNGPIFKNFMVL